MVHALVGKRSEEAAKRFVRELARKLSQRLPLFTSDELPHYREALAECYSRRTSVPPPGKRGRPFNPIRQINPDLCYATVHKTRQNQRVVKVERRVVFGNESLIEKILEASPFSNQVNTAGVERQNLNLRQHSRRLMRKTNGFSKIKPNLEAQVVLIMAYYNFVLLHGSLHVKGLGSRTPAMAGELTDHKWSILELLTYRIANN
jgi:transposase-like protein